MAEKSRPVRPAVPLATRIRAALDEKKATVAAELLEAHGNELLLDGESAQLRSWVDETIALDPETNARPRLALVHAWALVDAEQYGAASARVAVAERAARAASMTSAAERDDDLMRRAAGMRAHLAWVNGVVGGTSAAMLHPDSDDHPVWRAAALLRYGRCQQLAGRPRLASDALSAAIAGASVSNRRLAKVVVGRALVVRGRALEALGSLDDASALYTRAAKVANETPDDATLCDVADAARVGLARLATALGDHESASTLLSKALTRADQTPEAVQALTVQLDGRLLALSLAALGDDVSAGKAAVDAAERFVTQTGRRWALPLLGAARARLALDQGDLGAAKRWAQQRSMAPAQAPSPTVVGELLLLARLKHAGCHVTVAPSEVEANLKAAQADGRVVDVGRLLAAKACVALSAGERKEAADLAIAAKKAAGAAQLLIARELPDLRPPPVASVEQEPKAAVETTGFPPAQPRPVPTPEPASSPETPAGTSSDVVASTGPPKSPTTSNAASQRVAAAGTPDTTRTEDVATESASA